MNDIEFDNHLDDFIKRWGGCHLNSIGIFLRLPDENLNQRDFTVTKSRSFVFDDDDQKEIEQCGRGDIVIVPVAIVIQLVKKLDRHGNVTKDFIINHKNTLVVDKKSKTIYRFEPHVTMYTSDVRIDNLLKRRFRNLNFRYVSTTNLCFAGPQNRQNSSDTCAYWCLYFLELLLSGEDIQEIIKYLCNIKSKEAKAIMDDYKLILHNNNRKIKKYESR